MPNSSSKGRFYEIDVDRIFIACIGFLFAVCGWRRMALNTVVDRRSVEEIPASGNGSAMHGIDVFFSIATSREDAQRRAILATAGE